LSSRAAAMTAAVLAALAGPGCTRSPHAAAPATVASVAAAQPAAPVAPLSAQSSDGVRIAYQVYGGGAPAIVLIHGWSCNSSYWRAQLSELAQRYTVVTLDLAGHGASGANRSDWSIDNYGADVAAVVGRVTIPRVVLVGHAMGGAVALTATLRIGARVLGIIGVDSFKSIGLPPPQRARVERQIAPFSVDFSGTMHSFVARYLFTGAADPGLVRRIADDMSRTSPQVAVASLIGLSGLDFAPLLPRIHVPIIAINSDLGDPTDEARIRKVAPTFRAITLAGTGDFLMLEAPQRFNPVLLREIAGLARGG